MLTTIGTDIEKRLEIQKDKSEIISFMVSVVNRPDYKKKKKKSIRFPYNYEASFKSKRGNRYNCIFTITDKKSIINPLISVSTTLDTDKGTYVLRYDVVIGSVAIFTPHFFKRYRERFLKDDIISPEEVRKKYLKRNPIVTITNKEVGDAVASCKDGYIYARLKDDRTIIYVTFVSLDMLSDEQLKTHSGLLEKIRKYEDLIEQGFNV